MSKRAASGRILSSLDQSLKKGRNPVMSEVMPSKVGKSNRLGRQRRGERVHGEGSVVTASAVRAGPSSRGSDGTTGEKSSRMVVMYSRMGQMVED